MELSLTRNESQKGREWRGSYHQDPFRKLLVAHDMRVHCPRLSGTSSVAEDNAFVEVDGVHFSGFPGWIGVVRAQWHTTLSAQNIQRPYCKLCF